MVGHKSHPLSKEQEKWKECEMAVKLDMSNAYDRVEWQFLKRMMMVMRFDDKFIRMIFSCVSTVQYSVRLKVKYLDFSNPKEVYIREILSPPIFFC